MIQTAKKFSRSASSSQPILCPAIISFRVSIVGGQDQGASTPQETPNLDRRDNGFSAVSFASAGSRY